MDYFSFLHHWISQLLGRYMEPFLSCLLSSKLAQETPYRIKNISFFLNKSKNLLASNGKQNFLVEESHLFCYFKSTQGTYILFRGFLNWVGLITIAKSDIDHLSTGSNYSEHCPSSSSCTALASAYNSLWGVGKGLCLLWDLYIKVIYVNTFINI